MLIINAHIYHKYMLYLDKLFLKRESFHIVFSNFFFLIQN